jgi:hypothetical protein
MSLLKMGKLPPKQNRKTLLFEKYCTESIFKSPPGKVYWGYKMGTDLRMFKNDEIGDCTCAAVGHMIMNMTAHQGDMVVPTDEQIVEAYSKVSGYDPRTGANDNGAYITDVLQLWQEQGIAGHKILGWAKVDAEYFNLATWLFGAVDVGMQVPHNAMEQFENGEEWDLKMPDGGIDGGHSVPFFNYGSEGKKGLTWAKLQAMTNAWMTQYVDERYAVISEDWFDVTGIAPNRFNKDELWADLKALAT